ncbi:hypothetical protein VQ056_00815 [Paenibacillus sp. JTLBN-2024]
MQARFAYFKVTAGETTDVVLTYRQAKHDIPVLGKIDRTSALTTLEGTDATLGELIGGSGAIVAWIEPEREPTKHLFREIGELAEPYAKLGAPIVLIIGNAEWTASFDPAAYPNLPSGTVFVRDASTRRCRISLPSPRPGCRLPASVRAGCTGSNSLYGIGL